MMAWQSSHFPLSFWTCCIKNLLVSHAGSNTHHVMFLEVLNNNFYFFNLLFQTILKIQAVKKAPTAFKPSIYITNMAFFPYTRFDANAKLTMKITASRGLKTISFLLSLASKLEKPAHSACSASNSSSTQHQEVVFKSSNKEIFATELHPSIAHR